MCQNCNVVIEESKIMTNGAMQVILKMPSLFSLNGSQTIPKLVFLLSFEWILHATTTTLITSSFCKLRITFKYRFLFIKCQKWWLYLILKTFVSKVSLQYNKRTEKRSDKVKQIFTETERRNFQPTFVTVERGWTNTKVCFVWRLDVKMFSSCESVAQWMWYSTCALGSKKNLRERKSMC